MTNTQSRHTARLDGKVYDILTLIRCAEVLPTEAVPRASFDRLLDDECWIGRDGRRLRPRDILDLAEKRELDWLAMIAETPRWTPHIGAVRRANYRAHPLLCTTNGSIVDGMHRLLRATLDRVEMVEIKRFAELPTEAEIPETNA